MINFKAENINIKSVVLNQRGLAAPGVFDLVVDLRQEENSSIFRQTFNSPLLTREEVAAEIGEFILTFIDQNNE